MNVSAVPDSLVESYLFGHERGAFPGADQAREGLFRAATGGTLFLDEVGELPLPLQAKLLRAVESKEILPVGADRSTHVDTRIVAATHCDLPAMVADGRFRQDLLYRLQVVELRVPALRDRKGDVAQLAKHFVEMHARAQRKPVRAITPEAMGLLSSYGWPGNVRELSNVIERAVILSSGDSLTPVDLPAELAAPQARAHDDAHDEGAARHRASVAIELTSDEACNLENATVAFHRDHIARVIDRAGGSRDAAAKLLGLSPATFYRYLQKVGLKGYQAET
jgi:DNA-binding NtrC family response regulator